MTKLIFHSVFHISQRILSSYALLFVEFMFILYYLVVYKCYRNYIMYKRSKYITEALNLKTESAQLVF